MLHVRIISDYPADPDLTGWPPETVDLTLKLPDRFAASAAEAHTRIRALIEAGEFFEIPSAKLPDRFAASAAEAHTRIRALIEAGEFFEIPSADEATPFEFAPELIRVVVVWEG